MMRVGVVVQHGPGDTMEAKFEAIRREGFTSCQLVSWNPSLWTEEEAKAVNEAVAHTGVTLSAFWCGWEGPKVWDFYGGQETLGLVPVAYRFARMQNLMSGADFAARLGVTDVVSHMGFIPENPYDPQYAGFIEGMKEVALHLKQNNQYLLFESGQETPVTMLRAFEDIGTGNLGVNLDTANLILYGKANPVDALCVLGPYVRGVHAKDGLYPTDGRALGKEVPLGQGKVDFPRFLHELAVLGYGGDLTIEREIEGEEQARDIRMARDFLMELLIKEREGVW